MSELKHTPIWYPPAFPVQGRLPRDVGLVYQNLNRQCALEHDYHDSLCVAAGRRVMPPCCKTVHISLFFDGTGNNLNNDLYESSIPHPTNIARLFRASIGAGHAGGTAHSDKAERLVDAAGNGNGQYFKYYMPGVGTPFPEVGDLDYSESGLATAWYGEERINWGLMMLIDALRRTLNQPRLDNAALQVAVKAMGTALGLGWGTGHANRSREFRKQLQALAKPLQLALTQPQPGQVKLLGLKLYVYGFSRGATAARGFVSWLDRLLSDLALTLPMADIRVPLSVEYLGLLDTVASVGIADIIPGAQGHMSWADGNQHLPESGLVKRCLHLVASHEQRLCFPLESIRRENGEYPANSQEVIYPGVHSDQGGGYPPGDQGKAMGESDGLLLSQIALNDLYADAFALGAPLKVPKEALSIALRHELWRAMEGDVQREFSVAPTLVERFNAWRQVTLDLPAVTQPLPIERIESYQPLPTTLSLEEALRTQLDWITAWRIDRYAFASLKQTGFYQQASDTEADKTVREAAEHKRDAEQQAIERHRKLQMVAERIGRVPKKTLKPGVKDFDADMAKTQLREAAEEFAEVYRSEGRQDPLALLALGLVAGPEPFWVATQIRAERERMKAAGQKLVSQLFPPPRSQINHQNETFRGNVDESRNAEQPEGLLRALFDDHVHDSRAWFLYKLGREPWGSFLRDRMVFFGESNSRALALYSENAQGQWAQRQPKSTSDPVPLHMDVERLAQVQKDIDELWKDFYAKARETNDAPS
ncbi:T6SS phospholipase effector Tle1-like catalytic domain-containing protein [Pseudomonas sp. NR3]|uniref:T6SS phospholipase effector Tle1-like catalytic domain-containing protein n=1 Tax=Pseudomonas sp. NR3 TaxID=3155978 RepID=UPI003B67A7A7